MELSDILNSLDSDSGSGSFSKTASDNSTDDLSRAIDRALGTSGLEKTASYASSPSADLMKVAGSLAQAESDALIKEAHVYGAAVADGFMSRMSGFEKNASLHTPNDAMIKQAYAQGYSDTSAMLQYNAHNLAVDNNLVKQAAYEGEMIKQAAFEQGFTDTIKQAAFEQGFGDTIKQAAFEQGFNDTVKEAQEFTKIAAAFEDYGYRYGNSVLSSL